jgi:competence protein ComEC
MRRTIVTLLGTAALAAGISATTPAAPEPAQAARTLDIYVIDTEGGGATLFVTPTGETILLDSGNPGERDHQRIMEVLKVAGVTKIDHMINSHYHVDHIGGLQQLAAAVPIAHYVDHGPTTEAREQVAGFQEAYAALRAKGRHTVVKPGDKLPVAGIDWTIVTSAGQPLAKPLPGAGQDNSAACAATQAKPLPTNDPDNAASVGSLVQFGQFRTIHLGDLYWAKELEFMCPQNRLGTVDLYLVSHHGLDSSGSPALVHGIRPRVAVMQNGTRKGGAVATNRTLFSSPGFQDLWQLHWSYNVGLDNAPAQFIANVDDAATIAGVLTAPPPAPGAPAARGGGPGRGAPGGGAHTPAYLITVTAQQDGTFSVTNTRNSLTKSYSRQR